MNNAEEKLWDYIDGKCSAEEQKAIATLLEQDADLRRKYEELLAFNAEMTAIELDEPPMNFTYKVMGNIRAGYAPQSLKAAINPLIVKGIGAFFMVTISALLLFILANINWTGGTAAAYSMPQLKQFLQGPVLKGFLFFDMVLLLFLLDKLLHTRSTFKHS